MSHENQTISSEPTSETYSNSDILKSARGMAIIGNSIGMLFLEAARNPVLSQDLNREVMPVVAAAFFVLAALGYFAGIKVASTPFVPEADVETEE